MLIVEGRRRICISREQGSSFWMFDITGSFERPEVVREAKHFLGHRGLRIDRTEKVREKRYRVFSKPLVSPPAAT